VSVRSSGLQQSKRGPRQRPQEIEFYIAELLSIPSKRTETRLLELFFNAILIDGRRRLFASGFEPNWRRYGVMTMLTTEVMQWALRSNHEVVNLSCGHDRGKSRWRPSEITFTHVVEKSPGLRGRLAMRSYRARDDARHLSAWLRGYRSGKSSNGSVTSD
jgi:hypothetical protein